MKTSTSIQAIFKCSKERAFKAPILGDATKFLNGYLFQAPVIDFEEDETWGEINGYRYPIIKDLFSKRTRVFTDTIRERKENEYWKWEVHNYTTILLFFSKNGVGEWIIEELEPNKIQVTYTYSYYARNILFAPLNWLFVKVQIKGMMQKAMLGIQKQAESGEDFYYEKLRGEKS